MMRSQLLVLRLFCLVIVVVVAAVIVVVVVVDVVFVIVVVLDVDIVVKATLKLDLRLYVIGMVGGGVQTHFCVKPYSVELS